jgi:folylpolyglutamate synthase/dihydropteroate synthase
VHLTNVALEHTDVLGDTREAIAREKLAVVGPDAVVVLGEPEWRRLLQGHDVRIGGARDAAEAFLGRPIEQEVEVRVPGRYEWRSGSELWDGAHTPEAADWVLARLPQRDWTVVCSILRDKRVDELLTRFARAGRTLIATRSSNDRALPADELARRARPYFEHIEVEPDPTRAVERARGRGPTLVTGSLYLLADLASERRPAPAHA